MLAGLCLQIDGGSLIFPSPHDSTRGLRGSTLSVIPGTPRQRRDPGPMQCSSNAERWHGSRLSRSLSLGRAQRGPEGSAGMTERESVGVTTNQGTSAAIADRIPPHAYFVV